MKIKYITIFLVLLCCIIGAASAADDVSLDAVDASVDDTITVDASIDDTEDSTAVEETLFDTVSDDTTTEEINEEIYTDEISEESALVDSEQTRATNVNAKDWDTLQQYANAIGTDYNIKLTKTSYTIGSPIIFRNNANIIGTPTSYITGGSSNQIPFQSTGSLNITFTNVTFRDINASVLIKLATTGTNKFINCSFDNVHTYAIQSSVIWNNGGWMTITGSNFTNCNNSFGAITNHKTYDTVFMSVENCRFENNTGRYEPGAINNCGVLNVTDSTFINNKAGQWAGAIHTHSNAYTRIVGSNFTDNVAGTNGGALFSYSKLEVINSTFAGNNATNNGGAICGYSYGSIYNITVCSSKFINDRVLSGAGGAIRAMNLGYLTVCHSNFTNNHASNGQAISGITETIDYCNCENCTCDDCPNCANCTHYISNESANLKLCNNTYLNHTGSGDTVTISGNDYIFDNNIFINSVQSVFFNGTGNIYNGVPRSSNLPENSILKSILGIIKLEGDGQPTELYINISREDTVDEDDEQIVSGADWDNAYGGIWAYSDALSAIANEGVIYVASGTYSNFLGSRTKSYTIIGQDNTIFSQMGWTEMTSDGNIHTYINLIFESSLDLNTDYGIGKRFFKNCTFRPDAIIIGDVSEDHFDHNLPDYGYDLTVFENCIFENYNTVIDCHKYENVEFKDCTFKNIEADSLIYTNSITEGAIVFDNCTFESCSINGVAKYINNVENLISMEDCNYDFEVSPGAISIDGFYYINSTGSKTATVLTAEVDADDNLVITLKDDSGNAVAGAQVLISVNGGDAAPFDLEDDGTLTKPLSDFASSTGPINIVVTFEKTNDYKGATQTVDYVIRTATSISAEDLTTDVNVAKDLTVTLLDNNGNKLAGKDIIVSVGGVNSTTTTDENGVAVIPVNYDTAGVYEYTLSFAGDDTTYKGSTKVVTVTVKESAPVTPEKVATKITAPKVSAVYNVAKNLVITLTDKDGKALANKKVTVKVGTISKILTTNAKGQVSLNVATLVPKTYTASVKFAGDDAYLASSVSPKVVVSKAKPQIVAKAKTFKVKVKTKKYTVTLKNNKGKVLKKVKLTLKVGKKTYKATTNSKGKATFKITKLTKKGKYTATVKFAGSKYYKALSKKVKITVKK